MPISQADVGITNCTGYLADVDALTAFGLANPAHMPQLDLSSFSGGKAGTPVSYLMFP